MGEFWTRKLGQQEKKQMPAVGGMRRNTRVFGTRVLRSGRRLWEEVGKHGEYVEGEWIDMLDNSGDDRMSSKEIDFNVITKTDENNAVGRDVKNRWGAVYRRRKRKTLESEMSDEDRMYGKKYFRKRRRTTSTCDGIWDLDSQVVRQEQMCRVIVIVLENYGGSISFGLFSCFLNSILRYMRCNSLRLRLLSAFLHYQPILSVYSSHGIRLQQVLDFKSHVIRKKGNCHFILLLRDGNHIFSVIMLSGLFFYYWLWLLQDFWFKVLYPIV